MTNMILRQSLEAALDVDRTLREWALSRLNLSHRAHVQHIDPASLQDWGFTPDGSAMFALVENRGDMIGLHIVPALAELPSGLGNDTAQRAQAMMQANAPVPHVNTRIALIAPPALVRRCWQAAREFPYWIDFDAFTKRQIDQRAA